MIWSKKSEDIIMKFKLFAIIIPLLLLATSAWAIVETDDFSTNTIGTKWSASTSQFQITGGVMQNIHQSGWALAVYKNATNASEASIKWAGTSNSAGVNAAGFALFLDTNDYTTASGYFVFIRNNQLIVTSITNGTVNRLPELDVKTVSTSPTPGSTMRVVYKLNGSTRQFTVYLGATLVGTVSTTQAFGATTGHYAGIVSFGLSGSTYIVKADEFSLTYPAIEITAPTPATTWTEGQTYDITWNATDLTGNVNIDYSTDNAIWVSLFSGVPASNGTQSWTVDKQAQSPSYLRIVSVDNPGVMDQTSFNIIGANPFLKLTSPAPGNVWFLNRVHKISWAYSKVQSIKIYYRKSGAGETWKLIDLDGNPATTPDDIATSALSFDWLVDLGDATWQDRQIKIKIEGVYESTTYSDESEYFDVVHLAVLEVKNAMGEPGKSANVLIRLKNLIEARGLAFTLNYDKTLLSPVIAGGNIPMVKRERIQDFTMTYNHDVDLGILKILLINLTGKTIPVGDDVILEIPFNINSSINIVNTPTTPLDLDNAVQLIDKLNKKVDPIQVIDGTFSFIKPGDVNSDGTVNADDYKILLQFVIGERDDTDGSYNDVVTAADFDVNGELNIYDLMKLWDILNPAP